MPLLIDMPILPSQVPSLDAILITHIDNDHFSRMTCTDLKTVCNKYYAPNYVGDVMLEEGILFKNVISAMVLKWDHWM